MATYDAPDAITVAAFPESFNAHQRQFLVETTSRIGKEVINRTKAGLEKGAAACFFTLPLLDEYGVFDNEDDDVGAADDTGRALEEVVAGVQMMLDEALVNLDDDAGAFHIRVEVDLELSTFRVRVMPSEAHAALVAVASLIMPVLAKPDAVGQCIYVVGASVYPVKTRRRRKGKEADWAFRHRNAEGEPPSFAFECGFSANRTQLMEDVDTWFSIESIMSVLIAYYSPPKASMDDVQLEKKPSITFELFERGRVQHQGTAIVDAAAVASDSSPPLLHRPAWSTPRQWAPTDSDPPSLEFKLSHFFRDEFLSATQAGDRTVNLDAWKETVLGQLEGGARSWPTL